MGVLLSQFSYTLEENKNNDDSIINGNRNKEKFSSEVLYPDDDVYHQDSAAEESDSSLIDSSEVVDMCAGIPVISIKCPKGLGPKKSSKDSWQHFYSQDIRNYNVFKMIQFASPSNFMLEPQRMIKFEYQIQNVIDCAKRVEENCFNDSKSKLDYLKLINEQLNMLKIVIDKKYTCHQMINKDVDSVILDNNQEFVERP